MGLKLLAGAASIVAVMSAAGAALATTPGTAVPSTQVVTFSVFLPPQNVPALKALVASQNTKGSANYHKWLTLPQALAQFGPSAATQTAAKSALTAEGLKIVSTTPFSIRVSGTAAQITTAFKANLRSIPTSEGGKRVVSLTPPVMPAALTKLSAIAPGLANIPEHKLFSTVVNKPATKVAKPANRVGPYGGYFYNDMKEAYDYPAYTALDGTGVNVGIVMSSDALDSDVAAMFSAQNFTATTGKPPPVINHIYINGTFPGYLTGAYLEASLDTQMVLGGAPGANTSLLVIPDLSDDSIIDGYIVAILSGQEIVTSSFGECELYYSPAYNNGYDFTFFLQEYDYLFALGSSTGMTFMASSGDEGALECVPNTYFIGKLPASWQLAVSSPASDPNVTAVGGGNLETNYVVGSLTSTYVAENAFGDPEIPYDPYGLGPVSGGYWGAGGGISQIWAQPFYQSAAYTGLADYTGSTTNRTLPDVGMQVGGCPGGISASCNPSDSYVFVYAYAAYPGFPIGLIGTSVSSPEFAGALALAVESYGPAGPLNYYLYQQGAAQTAAGGAAAPPAFQYLHQGIPGYDGYYTNALGQGGYNYMYGNGSPDVRALFGLTGAPPAGDPQTASNP